MPTHVDTYGPNDAISVITLDRPERRNALDHDTLSELLEIIKAAKARPTRALILTGAGGHFCAGADLTGVEDAKFATYLQHVLDHLRSTTFPTIAAVEGAALGAGTQLAVACDLRVATPDALFGIPAAKLGLMVNHWTVQRVELLFGHSSARAILLAAEVIKGDRAFELGAVNRQGSLPEAKSWAEQIAELAPLTIAGHKLMWDKGKERQERDSDVGAAGNRAWASKDRAEGDDAFRNRRPPKFEGH